MKNMIARLFTLSSLLCAVSLSTSTLPVNAASTVSSAEADAFSYVENAPAVYTDSLGNSFSLAAAERTAVCSGSLASAWQLAGGTLTAVTEDYWDEDTEQDETILSLGSLKTPDLESIIDAEVDFVILSANLTDHLAMQETLSNAGIVTAYYDVNTFDEYAEMMKTFTSITERPDLYDTAVTEVSDEIDIQLARADGSSPRILLLRSFSSGISAKGSDSLAGQMLKDLGCENIADTEQTLVDNLSMEAILMEDPDYIFVTYMGKEKDAAAYMEETLTSDPAWQKLRAVSEDHFFILEKALFQNKPNERWAESYTVLADILYGESIG